MSTDLWTHAHTTSVNGASVTQWLDPGNVVVGTTLTDENCSEDAWIVWLQHWCQPCVEALRTTVACAGCETEMTGIPGMDWGVWTSWDGRVDHVCETCHQQAEARQAQDMAARAARL